MAKGQQKGNREVKKPKADKTKVIVSPASASAAAPAAKKAPAGKK